MEVQIPDFADPYLEQFAFCGLIDKDDAEGIFDSLPFRLRAKFESNDGRTIFASLFVGDFDAVADPDDEDELDAIHVHLDLAAESFFHGELPTAEHSSDIGEIRSALERIVGIDTFARLDSRFAISFGDVPKTSIVRSLLEIEVPALNLSLTGSRFDIAPAPVRQLTWFIENQDEEKRLIADVTGWQTGDFGEDTLGKSVEHLKSAFDTVIVPGRNRQPQPQESGNA